MDLIKELKEEHIEILRYFNQIQEEYKNEEKENQIIVIISELKELLIQHLELEDRMLYPALSENENVKKAGKEFSEEMLIISKWVIGFFKKYEKENVAKWNEVLDVTYPAK